MARYSVALPACFLALCFLFGCAHQGQEMASSGEPQQRHGPTISSTDEQKAATERELAKGYAKDVLPLFVDSAKTFSQMAIAALGLTIVFREKVLGASGPMKVGGLLMASWGCFLVSIGAGLSYQWLGIRLISLKDGYEPAYFPLKYGLAWPGNIYGIMLIAFFAGAILLVVTSAAQLLSGDKELPE